MNASREHEYGKFRYLLTSRPVASGEHQGIIVLVSRENSCYNPPVEITTPTTFKKSHAAEVEAAALAYELINSRSIEVLVPTKIPQEI